MPPQRRAAASRAAASLAELSDSGSENKLPPSPYKPSRLMSARKTRPKSTSGHRGGATTFTTRETAGGPASSPVRGSGKGGPKRTLHRKPESARPSASIPTRHNVTETSSDGESSLTELSDDPEEAPPARSRASPSPKPGSTRSSRTKSPSPPPIVPRAGLARSGSSLLAGLLGGSSQKNKRSLHSDADTEDDDDGLPSTISRTVERVDSRMLKPPRKKRACSPPSVARDLGPDVSLTIPGQVVLAAWRDQKYWPATLNEYLPPRGLKGVGKYRVIFFDKAQDELRRDQFKVYPDDEDFATCQLGNIESRAYKDPSSGEVLPPESDPTFPLPRDFHIAPMRVQFAYIKPVILSIMNGSYSASSLHDKFFQGQKNRQEIMRKEHLNGSLGDDLADALGQYLRRWLLGADFARVREIPADYSECSSDGGRLKETAMKKSLAPFSLGPPLEDPSGYDPSILDSTYHHLASAAENACTGPDSVLNEINRIARVISGDGASLPPQSSSPFSVTLSNDNSDNDQTEVVPSLAMQPCEALPSLALDTSDVVAAHTTDQQAPIPTDSIVSASAMEETTCSRPRGCDAYEALDALEKLHYCENVLRPEAIYQLLLWHRGERTVVAIQSDTEEARLRAVGVRLSEELDIVTQALTWRKEERRKRKLSPDGAHPHEYDGAGKYSSSGRAIRERILRK